jgi:hypothetical protein
MSDQDGSTLATDMVPEHATTDDVVHEAAEQAGSNEAGEAVAVDSEANNDEDEFIVISQDQAPIELAEEYPQVQVFPHIFLIWCKFEDNYPIGGDEETEDDVPSTSPDQVHDELADEQTEDEISQDAQEVEAPANVEELSKDVTEEKEDTAEIEIHEVPPPEVVAEELPSEVIEVNEDGPSESIDPPADIEDQTENEAVVENPLAENELAEEAADQGAETIETAEDEITVSPPVEEEGKDAFLVT